MKREDRAGKLIRKTLAGMIALLFAASPAQAFFCRTPELWNPRPHEFLRREPELSCWYGNLNFPLLHETESDALAMDVESAYVAGETEDFFAVEVLVFDLWKEEDGSWSEGQNVRPQRFWLETVAGKIYWEAMGTGRMRKCTKRETRCAAMAVRSAGLPMNATDDQQ